MVYPKKHIGKQQKRLGGIMKLSTKGRYGLMAMYRLGENYGKGPTSLKAIAEKENLSELYLEQLFMLLRKKGLVEGVRGAGGGYLLTKDPKEIKIGDILNALEGEIELSCCNKESDCNKMGDCATKDILDKIQVKLEAVFDSMTLADM
ncbi:putative HTH-type transcriptional regulator CymR [Clostridiales bacterium KA00134]|nr:putative HTH-type transcriptional regulator CymR [Clostridiales bacterium KA00134]